VTVPVQPPCGALGAPRSLLLVQRPAESRAWSLAVPAAGPWQPLECVLAHTCASLQAVAAPGGPAFDRDGGCGQRRGGLQVGSHHTDNAVWAGAVATLYLHAAFKHHVPTALVLLARRTGVLMCTVVRILVIQLMLVVLARVQRSPGIPDLANSWPAFGVGLVPICHVAHFVVKLQRTQSTHRHKAAPRNEHPQLCQLCRHADGRVTQRARPGTLPSCAPPLPHSPLYARLYPCAQAARADAATGHAHHQRALPGRTRPAGKHGWLHGGSLCALTAFRGGPRGRAPHDAQRRGWGGC